MMNVVCIRFKWTDTDILTELIEKQMSNFEFIDKEMEIYNCWQFLHYISQNMDNDIVTRYKRKLMLCTTKNIHKVQLEV